MAKLVRVEKPGGGFALGMKDGKFITDEGGAPCCCGGDPCCASFTAANTAPYPSRFLPVPFDWGSQFRIVVQFTMSATETRRERRYIDIPGDGVPSPILVSDISYDESFTTTQGGLVTALVRCQDGMFWLDPPLLHRAHNVTGTSARTVNFRHPSQSNVTNYDNTYTASNSMADWLKLMWQGTPLTFPLPQPVGPLGPTAGLNIIKHTPLLPFRHQNIDPLNPDSFANDYERLFPSWPQSALPPVQNYHYIDYPRFLFGQPNTDTPEWNGWDTEWPANYWMNFRLFSPGVTGSQLMAIFGITNNEGQPSWTFTTNERNVTLNRSSTSYSLTLESVAEAQFFSQIGPSPTDDYQTNDYSQSMSLTASYMVLVDSPCGGARPASLILPDNIDPETMMPRTQPGKCNGCGQ